MFKNLSKLLVRFPLQIFFVIGFITVFFFWLAFVSENRLQVDFSLEQMFPEGDPQKEIYDLFTQEFQREDDKLLLVYDCYRPTSRENIVELAEITEMLELDVSGIENVLSLSNIDDGEYFHEDLSDEEWSLQEAKIIEHPIYRNLIISKDGKTAAILVDLQDDINDQRSRSIILDGIDKVLRSSSWDWYESGIPVLRTRYIQLMNKERSIFMPVSFFVAAMVLFMIFRQWKCIVVTLFSIAVTLIWVAGIMAYLGITINVVSYLTFNLLMIIGASNAIHLLMKYHENLNFGYDKSKALQETVINIGSALFLTSFTTAVGFSSLAFTNIKITQQFGLLVGFGVLLMFLLIIIVMPILLNMISRPNKIHIDRLMQGSNHRFASRLNLLNNKYPSAILMGSVLIFAIAMAGLYKMDYNASVLEDLKQGNVLYDNMKFVERELGGTLSLEVIIDTDREMGALDPVFMEKVQIFKSKMLNISEISGAITLGDYLMLINERFGSGFRELPQTEDDALSYIFEYDDAKRLSNADYSKARISARIVDISYTRGEDIKNELLHLGSKVFQNEHSISITGSTLVALSTNRHLVKNLTTSFMIAFCIIFASIVVLFRSFRLSLLAILPNMIPLMVAGGLMGYLGIKLRPSTAMTFSIALGIAVDNTIHFLARFRQEFQSNNNYLKSISNTLLTTGKAIISTGAMLSLGFFVMFFSEFVPNHEFGLLATMIIVSAVFASLILLPVLIYFVRPKIRIANIKTRNL